MKKLISVFLSRICLLLGFFPRSWIRSLGSMFGFLWIDLFKIRLQVVMSNLKIAFPEMSVAQQKKIARASVYNMGSNLTEFFLIPSVNSDWIHQHVVFEGWDHLIQAQNQGRGVLMLSMHLGNGELATTAMSLRGLQIYVITKVFKNPLINNLWFSIRGYHGVKYIDAHGPSNAFEILKVLKKKAAVVFVLDQFMGKPFGIKTHFFGKATGTAYGLALFYLKTRSPVVPTYTFEGSDGKMHVVFDRTLDLDPLIDDDKDASILRLTQYFNDKIEEIVRKYPEQWMWVHRRWKEFE